MSSCDLAHLLLEESQNEAILAESQFLLRPQNAPHWANTKNEFVQALEKLECKTGNHDTGFRVHMVHHVWSVCGNRYVLTKVRPTLEIQTLLVLSGRSIVATHIERYILSAPEAITIPANTWH